MNIRLDNFEVEAQRYGDAVVGFAEENYVPLEIFQPPDHIAIKAYGLPHYKWLIKDFRPRAELISQTWMNERWIATVVLSKEVSLGGLGSVALLELMQPRREKEGKDKVGIDHVEVGPSDLMEASKKLRAYGIDYVPDASPRHQVLAITFHGHELKITDRSLVDITNDELETGAAELIYPKTGKLVR